jgi:allantoinase
MHQIGSDNPFRAQVTKDDLRYKNKISPYEGKTLTGRVEQTYLRGQLVYNRGRNGFDDLPPIGKLI